MNDVPRGGDNAPKAFSGAEPKSAKNSISADLERVDGFARTSALSSQTEADATPRIEPIEGIAYRLLRPVSHHHGHLVEAFRADWGVTERPIVQVNMSVTFPGATRGWGLHRRTEDRLFAATGSLCIVCYDGRKDSPTFGTINEFILGGRNHGFVLIPPGIYHAWKNIGTDEAMIISMPSQLYDHDGPDRWELPWDSLEAEQTIPYRWP